MGGGVKPHSSPTDQTLSVRSNITVFRIMYVTSKCMLDTHNWIQAALNPIRSMAVSLNPEFDPVQYMPGKAFHLVVLLFWFSLPVVRKIDHRLLMLLFMLIQLQWLIVVNFSRRYSVFPLNWNIWLAVPSCSQYFGVVGAWSTHGWRDQWHSYNWCNHCSWSHVHYICWSVLGSKGRHFLISN